MIKTFLHKGVRQFFETGSKAAIKPVHAPRLRLHLAALDVARSEADMAFPGWKLHPLKGDLAGHWAVWVDKSWRLTFRFEVGNAVLVDYQDYH